MLYSVLFRFGHVRRSDQCAVYILYSKISTDPGLPLKIRHSHRFVAVVIQFLIFHLFRKEMVLRTSGITDKSKMIILVSKFSAPNFAFLAF